jgi:hypothetical protein
MGVMMDRGQTMSVISLPAFPAGFSIPTQLWTSETKISLTQPNLQINATFTLKLVNSAPRK